MSPNLEVLLNHCKRFRSAMERTNKRILPLTLRDFPCGACGDATLLLAKYLEQQGCGTFDYMLGNRDGHSHAWVQQGDLIADIIADQFPDIDTPVIVTLRSAWHVEFQGEVEHVADYEIFDERTRAVLNIAYAAILDAIDLRSALESGPNGP